MIHSTMMFVHVLCMIGAFGVLAGAQFALPASLRNNEQAARGISRLCNIFIGIGLIAGLHGYFAFGGFKNTAHVNGVIGLKFILLLAVGALIAMSKKPGKGDTFRTISLVLLVIAGFLGRTQLHLIP